MAFIPSLGVAEVTFNWQQPNGTPALNRFHAWNGTETAWTVDDLTTLVGAFAAMYEGGGGSGDGLKAVTSNAANLVNIATRDLTTETSTEFVASLAEAGEDTGTPLPAGVSLAVTFRSGVAGRSFRGRMFVANLTENFLGAGPDLADVDKVAIVTDALTTLVTSVPALSPLWTWCVLSLRADKADRANGLATPITDVGVANFDLDYQRRRALGHNRHGHRSA